MGLRFWGEGRRHSNMAVEQKKSNDGRDRWLSHIQNRREKFTVGRGSHEREVGAIAFGAVWRGRSDVPRDRSYSYSYSYSYIDGG
eukprot:scaffold17308_cov51-Attheya_sp.AAC.4